METPLFDESCIRVAGIHASGMRGVGTIGWAGRGRNGLSAWAQSGHEEREHKAMNLTRLTDDRANSGEWWTRTSHASTGYRG